MEQQWRVELPPILDVRVAGSNLTRYTTLRAFSLILVQDCFGYSGSLNSIKQMLLLFHFKDKEIEAQSRPCFKCSKRLVVLVLFTVACTCILQSSLQSFSSLHLHAFEWSIWQCSISDAVPVSNSSFKEHWRISFSWDALCILISVLRWKINSLCQKTQSGWIDFFLNPLNDAYKKHFSFKVLKLEGKRQKMILFINGKLKRTVVRLYLYQKIDFQSKFCHRRQIKSLYNGKRIKS